jgi:hypothetical protein
MAIARRDGSMPPIALLASTAVADLCTFQPADRAGRRFDVAAINV